MADKQNSPGNPLDGNGALTAEAHGRAALLLTESLIHALVDKQVLTLPEAIELIDIATEVEREVAAKLDGGKPPPLQQSLLAPLANSLRGGL